MEFIIIILLIIIAVGVYLQSNTGREILNNLKRIVIYTLFGIFYIAIFGLIIFSLLNLTDEEIPEAMKSWSNFMEWLLTFSILGLVGLIIYKIREHLVSRKGAKQNLNE